MKTKSAGSWKYLYDDAIGVLIRSDSSSYEYFDVCANAWVDDPFGRETFSGHSNDSARFKEIPERKIPNIIENIFRLMR